MSEPIAPVHPIALITGGTAGIGAAFARALAAKGYDLVLVARGEARLAEAAKELADRHGVTVSYLRADLSTTEGCDVVAARLADRESPIDLLVNNAGGGLAKGFVRASVAEEEGVLDLNVRAVLRLTHAALQGMLERRRGEIINVSSVVGFGPVMPGSTYPAAKAWVTSFTESIGDSVRRFGVRVMALAPGYTRTEFHQRVGLAMSHTPARMWLDADDVVATALRDLARGKRISVPDWRYKTTTFAIKHLPRAMLRRGLQDNRGRITEPPTR
jgi:uncharacterized protein